MIFNVVSHGNFIYTAVEVPRNGCYFYDNFAITICRV